MADMKTLSDGTTTYNVVDPTKLPLSGGTMTGNINANEVSTITNLKAPTNDLDAATKKYVDDKIASAIADLITTEQMAAAIQGITLESLGGGQQIVKVWEPEEPLTQYDEGTIPISNVNNYDSFIIVTSNASTFLRNDNDSKALLLAYLNVNTLEIGKKPDYDMYFAYRFVEIDNSGGGIKFCKAGYRKEENTTNVSSYLTGLIPRIIYGILNS